MKWKKHTETSSGQYSFNLDGQNLPYILKRSPRARYLRLEIQPGAGLVVVAPRHCSLSFIENFIQQKQSWIQRKLQMLENCALHPLMEIRDGGEIFFLGNKVSILMRNGPNKGAGAILEGEKLLVNLDRSGRSLPRVVEDWYRLQAKSILKEKLDNWSHNMGIPYTCFSVRGQKTRWGSCSRRGSLSLNWKLLKTPEPIIDYVIIHELAHLEEMNHSRDFWKLVALHYPQYKHARKWLSAQNGMLTP